MKIPCCSVCLGIYAESETFFSAPCGHLFHNGCLNESLRRSQGCPVCRNACQNNQIKQIFIEFADEDDLATLNPKQGSVDTTCETCHMFQAALEYAHIENVQKDSLVSSLSNDLDQSKERVKELESNSRKCQTDLQAIRTRTLDYEKGCEEMTDKIQRLENELKIQREQATDQTRSFSLERQVLLKTVKEQTDKLKTKDIELKSLIEYEQELSEKHRAETDGLRENCQHHMNEMKEISQKLEDRSHENDRLFAENRRLLKQTEDLEMEMEIVTDVIHERDELEKALRIANVENVKLHALLESQRLQTTGVEETSRYLIQETDDNTSNVEFDYMLNEDEDMYERNHQKTIDQKTQPDQVQRAQITDEKWRNIDLCDFKQRSSKRIQEMRTSLSKLKHRNLISQVNG